MIFWSRFDVGRTSEEFLEFTKKPPAGEIERGTGALSLGSGGFLIVDRLG